MNHLAFWVLSISAVIIGLMIMFGTQGSRNPTWGALGLIILFGGFAGLVIAAMLGLVESKITKQHEKAAILTKRKIESIFESQMKEVSNAGDPLNIRDSLPDTLNVRRKLNKK